MIKKLLFCLVAFLAVLPQTLSAQELPKRYKWPGVKLYKYAYPGDVGAIDTQYFLKQAGKNQNETITNLNTLFLVNLKAWELNEYRCFFNQGGHWGVEGELQEIGIPLFLQENKKMYGDNHELTIHISDDTSDGARNHVSYLYKTQSKNPDECGIIIDRTKNETWPAQGNTTWHVRMVNSGTMYGKDIDCFELYTKGPDGDYWMEWSGFDMPDTDPRKFIITPVKRTNAATVKDEDLWIFVTKQDVIDRFEKEPASYTDVADCSFYIDDPDFDRNNGKQSSWNLEKLGEQTEININNKAYCTDSNNEPKFGASGLDAAITEYDQKFCSSNIGDKPYYNIPYGAFFNAEIKNGPGCIKQEINEGVVKAGWYMVTCQGFYRPGNNSQVQNAYLYVKGLSDGATPMGQYNKAYLPLYDWDSYNGKRPTNLTESGIAFAENRENYSVKVPIWIPKGGKIEFGVKLENSTGSADEWVAVDNMHLKYLGDDYLISENALEREFNYQWQQKQYQTMVLERQFQMGKWCSLVLPVDVNRDQLVTAFGNDVQLAELQGVSDDGKTIQFKTINVRELSWEELAIKKGKPYLIKLNNPGIPNNTTSRAQPRTWTTYGGNSIDTREYTPTAPLYIFPAMSYDIETMPGKQDYIPNNMGNGIKSISSFYNYDGTSTLLNGSTASKVFASENTYTYVMNDGNLTRYRRPFKLKGLRWWLDFKEAINGGNAKIGFVSDDVVINGIQTIDNDEIENHKVTGIYTLDGRKINCNDTKQLQKGVYIVNGKKIIVK
ncbi:MAG: hypothetical protein ACOYJK_10085 [Prevotella sp.]|jgi:hypothetical protein